jgi:hypothetical protein
MLSTTTITILGIAIIISIIVLWKMWQTPTTTDTKTIELEPVQKLLTNNESTGPPAQTHSLESTTPPTPVVFAVNDNGNLDLTDINGNLLNMHFGPNPKIYINLLDMAEKDVAKIENTDGTIFFTSNVGDTKKYELFNNSYIINYTHL